MGAEICFDAYLRSIVKANQKWEKQYTLTDVTGRSLQEKAIASSRKIYLEITLLFQVLSKRHQLVDRI